FLRIAAERGHPGLQLAGAAAAFAGHLAEERRVRAVAVFGRVVEALHAVERGLDQRVEHGDVVTGVHRKLLEKGWILPANAPLPSPLRCRATGSAERAKRGVKSWRSGPYSEAASATGSHSSIGLPSGSWTRAKRPTASISSSRDT